MTFATNKQATLAAKRLVKLSRSYFNGEREVPDSEYDGLKRAVMQYEEKHGDLGVPYKNIGAPVEPEYTKFTHKRPMLSLDTKVETTIDVDKDFFAKLKDNGIEEETVIIEPKWDGLALSIHYENGHAKVVATRGDGIEGEDVTRLLALEVEDLPLTIADKSDIEVRGELMVSRQDLERANTQRIIADETIFKNCRNAVAGIVRRYDASAFKGMLTFRAYDVLREKPFNTQLVMGQWLNERGFAYEFLGHANNPEETFEVYALFSEERKEKDFDTDGCVYKLDNIKLREKIPSRATTPGWAIAHKYDPPDAITVLEDIVYGVGRTGRITPVAMLVPVDVGGVTVTTASLKNEAEMLKLDVRVGEMVVVHRAGDVIPEIKSAIFEDPDNRPDPPKFPACCPDCASPLIKDKDGSIWYCQNRAGCEAQMEAYWEHVVSREVLNITGIGESGVKILLEEVRTLADLFDLTLEKLVKAGFTENKSKEIMKSIDRINDRVHLWRLYCALGIVGVGPSTAKQLSFAFPDLAMFVAATERQLLEVSDVGDVTAQAILAYVKSEEGAMTLSRLYDRLDGHFILIDAAKPMYIAKACITGTFDGVNREQAKHIVENTMLYEVLDNVTKEVDFLFVGKNPSESKLKKAAKLGIKLVTDVNMHHS